MRAMYSSVELIEVGKEELSVVDGETARKGGKWPWRALMVAFVSVSVLVFVIMTRRSVSTLTRQERVQNSGASTSTKKEKSLWQKVVDAEKQSDLGGNGQQKKGDVEEFHFPDMVHLSEHHEEIFGDFKKLEPDENGFMTRNVHVIGHEGRELHVNYRGRYKARTHFHNLENWDSLAKFGCTKDGLVLEYTSDGEAHRALADVREALASPNLDDVLVTGKQLLRCPKSEEPDDVLNAHEFPEEIRASQTRISQTVRRVHSVKKKIGKKSKKVFLHLETSFANLLDVFEDLEFSGKTNMVERDSKLRRKRYRLNEPNTDGILRVHADEYEEHKKSVMYPRVRLDSAFISIAREQEMRRRLGWLSKAFNWVVDKIVKPIVNFVKDVVKSVTKFVKAVVGTIIQPVLAFLGTLIPELVNKSGHETFATGSDLFSINYDSAAGRASRIWELDMNGMQDGPFFEAGQTSLNILGTGKVACTNCFIRFYDGWFDWHVIIGGRKLGFLEMKMGINVELSIELEATITIQTQITQGFPGIPIPFLSVELGVMTLGFELAPEISIGLVWEADGFYYHYHMIGWQEFGVRASIFGGVQMLRDGELNRTSTGPLVKNSMKASVYVLPLCGLVLNDVMAIEAGLQPTLSFLLKPMQSPMATCALDWEIAFDASIVVGAWIGLKTPFGMWRLAGFSHSFSVLPTIKLASGCVTREIRNVIEGATGMTFFSDAELETSRALAANPTNEAAYNTEVNDFNAGAQLAMDNYPMTNRTYPSENEKWVVGNDRSCSTACSQDAPGYTAYRASSSGSEVCAVMEGCTVDAKTNIWGGDMPNMPLAIYSGSQCAQKCLETAGCKCWAGSYPFMSGCYLKSSCTSTSQYSYSTKQSGICTDPDLVNRIGQMKTGCEVPTSSTATQVFTGAQYSCFCVKDSSKYSKVSSSQYQTSTGVNCGLICETKGKEPVVSGSAGSTHINYMCAHADAYGTSTVGFNLGGLPMDPTWQQKCVYTDRIYAQGLDNTRMAASWFDCICREPQQPLPEPLRWVNWTIGASCAQICDDEGQYAVTTDVKNVNGVDESYMACRLDRKWTTATQTTIGFTGTKSSDGSYTTCEAADVSPSDASAQYCLCSTSLQRYVSWYDITTTGCQAECNSQQNRFAISATGTSNPLGIGNYLCAAKPGANDPWIAGYATEGGGCATKLYCGSNSEVDIPGGNMAGMPTYAADATECARLCETTVNCNCWAMRYPGTTQCWLKHVCASTISRSGVISGYCSSWHTQNYRCACSTVDIADFIP